MDAPNFTLRNQVFSPLRDQFLSKNYPYFKLKTWLLYLATRHYAHVIEGINFRQKRRFYNKRILWLSQPVTHPINGLDIAALPRLGFNFAAQVAHVAVQGALRTFVFITERLLDQFAPGKCVTWIF